MPFAAANPALAQALLARGYTELTEVQSAVLQPGAEARDLLVSAQTGSGKTVAYGLAFAPTLLGAETRLPPPGRPLALIVAPTRELAMQVQRELAWLYAAAGARIASCIGGMDGRQEARALAQGCHMVVGTPGRLCDHLRRGTLDLSDLRVAVLDEADEMLDLGFREEMEALLAAAPEWRRTLLFSATLAREIITLARQYQRDALRIDTIARNQPHADIIYRAVRVAPREIEHAVVNVLRFVDSPTALIFCATRDGVRHLQASLQERGFTSVALSGELTQAERNRALTALRDGMARVCVATDVAARGLDLPDLDLVIHADLPTNKATLLHRSGRTGRAGRKGMCVVIVPASRTRAAEQLFAAANLQPSWSSAPPPEEIHARDGARLLEDPLLSEPADPADQVLAQTLLEGRTAEDVAAALIRLYRARLPAPEEITDPGGPARRQDAPRPAQRSYNPAAAQPAARAKPGPAPLLPALAQGADANLPAANPHPKAARPRDDAAGQTPVQTRAQAQTQAQAQAQAQAPFAGARAARGARAATARPGPGAPPPPARGEPTVWFSLPMGRKAKADPKWLLPMICKLGQVEKAHIGAIRVLDRETRFEVVASAAEHFAASLPPDGTAEVIISHSHAPAGLPGMTRAGKKPHAGLGPKKPRVFSKIKKKK